MMKEVPIPNIGHVKEPDKKYPGRLPTEKNAFAEKYGVEVGRVTPCAPLELSAS